MRAAAFALVLLVACDKGQPAKPAPVAKRDAAVVAADAEVISEPPMPGPPEVDYAAIDKREHDLPRAKPCTPTCSLPGSGPDECTRGATARLFVRGIYRSGNNCDAKTAVIDCCPAISVDDRQAVVRALGWEHARAAQRTAIAWSIAYAVEARQIIDNPVNGPRPDVFVAPSAKVDKGEVTLDYWYRTESSADAHFVREQLVVHADGSVDKTQIADVAPNY